MMNSLLASVSASALMAGGGVAPPAGPLLTYVGHAATGTDNATISLSFPEVGFYVLGIGGASGQFSGAENSPITLTTVNGEPITQVGTYTSDGYEEVTFGYVYVATPGVYAVNYTYSTTSYRRYAVNWKASLNADLQTISFHATRGINTSLSFPVLSGSHVCLIGGSRSGTIGVSGLDNIIQASVYYEGSDPYMIYDEEVTVDGTKVISDTSTSTTSSRYVYAAINVTALPENLTVYGSKTNVVLGANQNGLSVGIAAPFVVAGFSATSVSINRASTYVILE